MFLTEIRGGSDTAAIRKCSAVKGADGWRVSGSSSSARTSTRRAIHGTGARPEGADPGCAAQRCSSSPGLKRDGFAATACTSGG